jgi:hypothetical protein
LAVEGDARSTASMSVGIGARTYQVALVLGEHGEHLQGHLVGVSP